MSPRLGVLALQGAFVAHQQRLAELGHHSIQVRRPDDLEGLDALLIPGGESTTMSMLLTSSGLLDPIAEAIDRDLAVLGTCAGMILLAREVLDGRPDQRCLGAIDLVVRRNGYGRQLDSFECELTLCGGAPDDPPFHGVFIRAPKVESVGPGVEVLAEHQGVPVLARQRRITVAAFHPELTRDARVHAAFIHHLETGST